MARELTAASGFAVPSVQVAEVKTGDTDRGFEDGEQEAGGSTAGFRSAPRSSSPSPVNEEGAEQPLAHPACSLWEGAASAEIPPCEQPRAGLSLAGAR